LSDFDPVVALRQDAVVPLRPRVTALLSVPDHLKRALA
jgi:hypothetical protein